MGRGRERAKRKKRRKKSGGLVVVEEVHTQTEITRSLHKPQHQIASLSCISDQRLTTDIARVGTKGKGEGGKTQREKGEKKKKKKKKERGGRVG